MGGLGRWRVRVAGQEDGEVHGEGRGAKAAHAACDDVVEVEAHFGQIGALHLFEHEAWGGRTVVGDLAGFEIGQAEAFEPAQVGGVVHMSQRVQLAKAHAVGKAEGPRRGDAEAAQGVGAEGRMIGQVFHGVSVAGPAQGNKMARIAFDLDGTVLDSAPDICLAGNIAMEGTGAAPMETAEARGYVGSGAAVFVERMRTARGLPERTQEMLLERFIAAYEGTVHQTVIYPGALEALEGLRAEGHLLAICTNKPIGPTRAVLAHFDLTELFGAIYGGDSLPVRKPDPAPLRAALGDLGEGPALFVGDSEVDAETGERAGVATLIYTPGYRKAPLESLPHAGAFDQWDGLPGLVARVLGELGAGNENRTRN